MTLSNDQHVKQIEAEMQVLADKWRLELIRVQDVDGRIKLQLGVVFTPNPTDVPAEETSHGG